MIKVILLIDCASEFDRKLLRGIMKYSKENGPWLFYRIPSDFRGTNGREEWVMEWAKKWNADAVIGRCDEDKVGLLGQLDIPIVLQNNRTRSDVYSNLTGDYVGTGQLAAEYFQKKLFTNYAFFGVRSIIWSEERCKGFREAVASKGNNFSSFNVEPRETFDRSKVLSWLEDLPKPVALFCCDDAHALYITETCNMAGLSVPKDIAVLGVDNDELLCGISDPPISSVELDVERGGYETCALLHRQIMNSTRQPFNVVINPVEVVQRQSSCIYNIKDPNVAKIVAFIDSNYNTNLDINGILKLVPLSRRSVETKFRKETGTTIYQYILKSRVEHLAHLLLTSDRPVSEIADEVGFGDNGSFSRIFRKMKGCSPQEYRQKNCAFRQ